MDHKDAHQEFTKFTRLSECSTSESLVNVNLIKFFEIFTYTYESTYVVHEIKLGHHLLLKDIISLKELKPALHTQYTREQYYYILSFV